MSPLRQKDCRPDGIGELCEGGPWFYGDVDGNGDSTSLGLFLDVGGDDTYKCVGQNNQCWLDPADSPNWNVRNFSIGVDRETGEVRWLPQPVKLPQALPSPSGGSS